MWRGTKWVGRAKKQLEEHLARRCGARRGSLEFRGSQKSARERHPMRPAGRTQPPRGGERACFARWGGAGRKTLSASCRASLVRDPRAKCCA